MSIERRALAGIKLVIFDLDGTLADTERDLALSVNAVREQMGLGPLPDGQIASFVGHGVTVLIRRALSEAATDQDVNQATELFLNYYRLHMLDHTVTYPGVREALEELRTRKLAVLTNKPVKFSRQLLAGLGIAGYFSSVYGGNSFGQKKPDPVGVCKLMSETGRTARQTLMVGDSETDVLTGRNAGVWTCGVTYGFGSDTLAAVPPDFLVDDLRELPRLLDTSISERGAPSQ